ncbi:hypothetical protein ACNS7O_14200 [Haloferacaceae archaeon DSL9]
MEWRTLAGIGLFAVGLVGYVVGIYIAYPGRAFSITAIMIGIALAAIAWRSTPERNV